MSAELLSQIDALLALDNETPRIPGLARLLLRQAAARLRELEEALKPFADEADSMGDDMPDDRKIDDLGVREVTEGHLRRARKALGSEG